jgi:hypothetical protein
MLPINGIQNDFYYDMPMPNFQMENMDDEPNNNN